MKKQFKDFAQVGSVMDGDKIKIAAVVDKEVEILSYRLANSHYKKGEQCLTIQFMLDGKKHVLFTGSNVLIEQCEKYKDEMPFVTTIKQVDKFYTFT